VLTRFTVFLTSQVIATRVGGHPSRPLLAHTPRALPQHMRCLLPVQSFGKVCLLSNSEAEDLEKDGVLPNCRNHRHMGRRAAETFFSAPAAGRREARWVVPLPGIKAKAAITLEFAPTWKPHRISDPELRALPGGPRFKSLQLIP